jgi:hypothetical protein
MTRSGDDADFIRRSRIARRRAHRAAALKRWVPKIVLLCGAAGVAAWSYLAGPLHNVGKSPSVTAGSTVSTTPSAAPVSTSTTEDYLSRKAYRPGDCVTWNQNTSDYLHATHVVPCTATHLIEIVHYAQIPTASPAPFPTQAEWSSLFDQLCGPLVTPYLGYALDPDGRFTISTISPSRASWAVSDRDLWCGIGARWPSNQTHRSDEDYPYSGVTRGQDQTYLFGVGTCLSLTLDGRFGDPVPCPEPHGAEITGSAPIIAATMPVNDQTWWTAIGPACSRETIAYAGGRLPAGMTTSFLQIGQASWAAGRRVVECTAVRFDANGHVIVTGGTVRART